MRHGEGAIPPLSGRTYEPLARLYILPGLASKRLDKITLRDVRSWLNKLRGLSPADVQVVVYERLRPVRCAIPSARGGAFLRQE